MDSQVHRVGCSAPLLCLPAAGRFSGRKKGEALRGGSWLHNQAYAYLLAAKQLFLLLSKTSLYT